MEELGLDALVVPTDDPHLSEYVADAYQRRAFITGFTGSAGTAVVTKEEGYLWTDSRYFNQANLELDNVNWKLMKMGEKNVPLIPKFLSQQALSKYNSTQSPFILGIDPYVHPTSFAKDVTDAFAKIADKNDISCENGATIGEIRNTDGNLIDDIWGADQPVFPSASFRIHPLSYAGRSLKEKVTSVIDLMKKKKASLSVISALDEVAYCLNLRGSDIDCNPVAISYLTINADGTTTLYCDECKITGEVRDYLLENDVKIAPYDTIVADVETFSKDEANGKVWIHTLRTNHAIASAIPEDKVYDRPSPIVDMKAVKNEVELEMMRQAHVNDGAAMARFISWLRRHVLEERNTLTEVEIDEHLTGERAKLDGFLEVSFPTIAGVGSNGAIIHYSASNDSPLLKTYDGSEPVLIDSGGQYEYGTTDVTRSWHFGKEPTMEYKEMYTRVLKGNMMLDSTIFPENTPGMAIDVLARRSLWEAQRDYGHGTGHGVGAAINVHEGPMSISPRWGNTEVLKKGHIVSNEPGFYKDGEFGIRIENLLEVVSAHDGADEEDGSGGKKFLKFQKLTMIPIQKDIILVELMTDSELDWLDNYHATVYEKVGPLLEEGSLAKDWLTEACAKIDRTPKN